MYLRFLTIFLSIFLFFPSYAQEFPMNKLSVDGWELGDWKQAESVDNPFKKKSGFTAGNKILFSNTSSKTSSKITTADAKVKFEFMLGNNSDGVFYIQGRHGILLSNTRPIGAIVKSDGSLQLPQQKVGKATGLWQKLEVTFSEAAFGNALTIEQVILNDVIIHQGYVLPSTVKNEGPLVFENNAGVVAVKNVEYLKYNKEKPLKLTDLNYELFETYDWNQQFAPKSTKPNETGTASALTHEFGAGLSRFLLIYKGNLEVEKDGNYSLIADYAGKGSLTVDGKEVMPMEGESYRKPRAIYLDLKKGKHPIELRYIKVWWRPELGLFAAGPEIRPYGLHAESSLPSPQAVGEIDITPKSEVELVRSFVMFNGKKRTHAISIGSPTGTHYTFDLDQGALLYAWRGDFADVTEMFHERGEPQLLRPKGVRTKFSGKPGVAMLSDINTSMPDSLDDYKDLVFKGYALDNEGIPSYKYQYNGSEITQKITFTNGGISNTVSAAGGNNLYHQLGEGKSISMIDKGFYLLETEGGDSRYIQLDPKTKPVVRNTKAGQEMILPINGTITYSVLW